MWPKPQFSWYVTAQKKETTDLVTFTEEILNGKLHFLCSEIYGTWTSYFCPSLSLIQFSHGTFWNVRTTFFYFCCIAVFLSYPNKGFKYFIVCFQEHLPIPTSIPDLDYFDTSPIIFYFLPFLPFIQIPRISRKFRILKLSQ